MATFSTAPVRWRLDAPVLWHFSVVAGVAALLSTAPVTPAAGQGTAPTAPAATPTAPAATTTAPPAATAEADPAPACERLTKLVTSDGVALAAWFYPAIKPEPAAGAAGEERSPVVILVHDLGGSHESVEPLARDLQARGVAVVAPDLRGHGATTGPADRDGIDAKTLKANDFQKMTMTGGGRVRDQAENRGDLETVRNWIRSNAERRKLDGDRFVVVGSGVGAAVAAQWTLLDAAWPDIASGPQGSQVRGLVFVSPAWTTRGFSISPALASEPVRRSLPMLVIGGARDADAVKIYEQLKRQRPDGWSEKRAGQSAPTQAPKLAANARPSLYLRQFDTGLSGDTLAAHVPKESRGGHPAAIIDGFVAAVTAGEP